MIHGAAGTTRWIGADGSPGRREWRTGYGLAVSAHGSAVGFAGTAPRTGSSDVRSPFRLQTR